MYVAEPSFRLEHVSLAACRVVSFDYVNSMLCPISEPVKPS